MHSSVSDAIWWQRLAKGTVGETTVSKKLSEVSTPRLFLKCSQVKSSQVKFRFGSKRLYNHYATLITIPTIRTKKISKGQFFWFCKLFNYKTYQTVPGKIARLIVFLCKKKIVADNHGGENLFCVGFQLQQLQNHFFLQLIKF